jgi:sec-independent protein translocase protein TatA
MRLSAPELIAIVLIIILLFGAKRLPATARSIGESLKIFKKSVRDDEDEKKTAPAVQQPQIAAASEPAQPGPQPAPRPAPQADPQPASADETKRVQS